MFLSLQNILALITTYKYAIIFPVSIVEGPIVTVIAGSLVSAGYLNIFLVFGLVVFGDLVGDTLYYCVGRYGGLYVIRRWNNIFKVNTDKLVSLENTFSTHGPKLLFAGKAQGLGSIVLMSAGLAKYPFRPFIVYNAIGTIIKSAILVYLGYVFGKEYTAANDYIVRAGIVASFVFLIVVYVYIRKKTKVV